MPAPHLQGVDDPARRVPAEVDVPERTPAEMLAVLRTMVNRQVYTLEAVADSHGGHLPEEWVDYFDTVLERVCKLAREERAREPTDEELLEQYDKEHGE